MNAELRVTLGRRANHNLSRLTVWVLVICLMAFAFGLAARAMNVALPEVYQPKPVRETSALTVSPLPGEKP